MKMFPMASVATAALAASLLAANAQSDLQRGRDRQPAAAQPSTQGTVQSAPRATTGRGSQPAPRESRSMNQNNQPQRLQSSSERQVPSGNSRASTARDRAAQPQESIGDRAAQRQQSRSQSHAPRNDAASRQDRRQERQMGERDRGHQNAARDRRETTGQGSERRETAGTRDNTRNARSSTSVNARSEQGRGGARLSEDQRTRVTARLSDRIDRMNIRPISRSRISVSIGRALPRSIALYDLPPDVVSIYPQFRGDRFVLVEDDIVVVEPGSRQVVAVLPRSGSRTASRETMRETTGTATRDEPLILRPEERQIIRTTVLEAPACHYEQRVDFFLFMPFPRTTQVCEFPRQVLEEVPELQPYRYTVHDNEVVVVDPDRERVIEVIR